MRLIVQDFGDPEVGIWGGDVSLDLDGINIEDKDDRKQIEEGFIKFLKDYDLVLRVGESRWKNE